jgi:hypothetical protein
MYQAKTKPPNNLSKHYQITVEGKIDPDWSDWFHGMKIVSKMEVGGLYTTTLSGTIIDQVALRGLLNRLWDLNLTVCSIQQINPDILSNTN